MKHTQVYLSVFNYLLVISIIYYNKIIKHKAEGVGNKKITPKPLPTHESKTESSAPVKTA